MPWPADPTLADTFLPDRSVNDLAGESGATTTMFSAPFGLYPVTETISVLARSFAWVFDPLMSIG